MKPIHKKAQISLSNIHDTIQLSSSSWLLKQPVVIFDLTKLAKKNTHPLIYQEKPSNFQEKYTNYSHIFIDSSKDSHRTGCRIVFNKTTKKYHPKEASIFTTETCTIELALNILNKQLKKIHLPFRFFLCTTIKNKKLDNPLITHNILISMNHPKKVIFCWIL